MLFVNIVTCLVGIALLACPAHAQLSRPPNMVLMPDETIFFKDGETVELPCKAEAEPAPLYTWRRDGRLFEPSGNDDRWVQLPGEGTLVCNRPEAKDVAMYQCFATNQHGTALSLNINLQQGRLETFPEAEAQTIEKSLGTPVTLRCVPPTSLPTADITWILRDQSGSFTVIDYDSHITMDYFGKLHITNLKPEDVNTNRAYVCMAINEFMRKNALGSPIYLVSTGQETTNTAVGNLWSSPVETKGLLGGTARMKCIFAGNPTPRVEWRRDSGPIPPLRSNLESFGMELAISDLEYADEGEYECLANNDFSTRPVSKTFRLTVMSKPEWQVKPQDVETSVNGRAVFMCKGKGKPRPQVDVTIDGKPLASIPTNPRRIVNRGAADNEDSVYINVTYVNLTKSDTQVIQCNISNTNGYIFTNAYLNILEDPPEFVRPPRPQVIVAEGQSVNLSCQTTGKPDPVITWFKEGRPITGGRYITLLNGDLLIMSVVLADAGHFGCEAANKFGSISANGTLAVRRRTRIEQRPLDLEVIAGNDAKFTCSATTDTDEVKQLEILWEKDDKPITPDNQRMTSNYQDNSLTVTGTIARDSGRYTCVATNGLDNATASAMLTVKGRPDPPTGVTVIDCFQDKAILEWSPGSNNNAPILHFIVQYNTTFTPDIWTFAQQVRKTQNNAEIPLTPWANYTFRVLSSNKIGDSEPSEPTLRVCNTKPDVPYTNPANVRTIGEKQRSLIVEWTEMPQIQHNGQGFQYLMSYRRLGDSSSNWEKRTVSDYKETRVVIDNVVTEPYQPFEIKVVAHNSVGDARADAPVIIGYTGEDEPAFIPTGLELNDKDYDLTATTATLEWDPLPDSESSRRNMKGEFMGYRIQYWKQNEKMVTFREQPVPHSSWNSSRDFCRPGKACVELTNLFPYSFIEAQVVVMNNFYIGPPSPAIVFQTSEGVPGPVKEFRAIVAGPNHFLLSWEKPEITDQNGVIRGYDIGFQTVDGLDLGKMQDREPQINDLNVVRTTLSGLRPIQKYRVHIWARTIKGRGEDYFIEVTTTRPGAPDAPKFTFSFIGEHMLNVTWQRPIEAGEKAGSIYYVEYKKLGASEWMQTPEESVNQWSNVTGLESGTVYQVRVVATTGTLLTTSAIQQVTTVGVGAIQIAGAGWLVGMMLAIVLVIIIIILICVVVVFLRKNCENVIGKNRHEEDYEEPRGAPPMRETHSQYPSRLYPSSYPSESDYPKGPAKGERSPSMSRSPYMSDGMDKGPPSYSDVDNYEEFEDPEGQEAGKFDQDGFIHSPASNHAPSPSYAPSSQAQEPATPSAMSTFV
ncbi:neuroglian-like isoform X2 [Liolophura sinensis]|uniref:neuroglian-like isoform X2 n=1 Tax=Liolophura sinensis TaxID=3198878 RepID=UPI003157F832